MILKPFPTMKKHNKIGGVVARKAWVDCSLFSFF